MLYFFLEEDNLKHRVGEGEMNEKKPANTSKQTKAISIIVKKKKNLELTVFIFFFFFWNILYLAI